MGDGLSRREDLVHESLVLSVLRRFVKGRWGRQSQTGDEQNHAERIVRTLWWRAGGMDCASSILSDPRALSAKILGDFCACPPDLHRPDPECVPPWTWKEMF
jgi:hypothetical protein